MALAVAVDTRRGHIFVLTSDGIGYNGDPGGRGRVVMLDAATGAVLRTTLVGTVPSVVNFVTGSADISALAVDEQTGRVFVANQPGPAPGFGLTHPPRRPPGSVSVLDAATGALVRTTPVGIFPVALADDAPAGRAFVVNAGTTYDTEGAPRGTVSVLDAATGRLVRTVALGAAGGSVVVDARRGRVYVTTGDGIRVLDAASGATRATVGQGAGVLAVDPASGRLVVAYGGATNAHGAIMGYGAAAVVDPASGRAPRTRPVGYGPFAGVVAGPGPKVFVLNSYGACPLTFGPEPPGSVSVFALDAP